ncbi:methyltransferase domain-containing protein [Ferrimonas balearica]|uniref:methyltransferase domain-containing protein n=1 Tax=Ferrimonas balearica TaxID=44012 RepID=UPI001C9A26A2|nr:methyltransferase domain-containing protein [Ferrimonas balearica]MBY5920981.1 methyltransferase domain-containing protein [Ferrimonas balearica]MBY5996334.1 methyltransferase domain-containing protein [Ferrimonas balearica]
MTQAIASCFGRAATIYDQHAHLQRRAAERLLSETDDGGLWLDLGTGTGHVARNLAAERVIALDLALPMLQQAQALGTPNGLCGDIMSLPIQAASVDGIAANLSLQWCDPLSDTLAELARVARPGAKLLATLPLAHTFPELRPLTERGQLACNRFADLQELKQRLQESPWSAFQLHPFTEVVHFDSVRALLGHFKATGAHHSQARQSGLRGRAWWHALNEQLSQHRTSEGFPLTWELVLVEATR